MGVIDDNPVTPLFEWFDDSLELVDADTHDLRTVFTAELAQHETYRSRILELLRAADLGVTDAKVEQADEETAERARKALRIMFGKQEDESVAGEALLDSQWKRVRSSSLAVVMARFCLNPNTSRSVPRFGSA